MLNTAVGAGSAEAITIQAAGQTKKVTWEPGSSINTVIGEIMKQGQSIQPPRPTVSRGSSGRSRGGSSSSRRSSSRSSSSRRSGGGGRRGFK
jgi:hypothetical protein